MNLPDAEPHEGGPNKLSMGYMYLNDEDGGEDQPQTVLVDHNHGRAFAYSTPRKGVTGEAAWVPKRMTKDMANM